MAPEVGVLFDAGTGIFRARNLIATETLHIFLSHVHLDHSIGLTFLFDVLWEKTCDVKVHVAEDKIDVINNHLFHPKLFPIKPDFELIPLTNQPYAIGETTTVEAFELGNHPGGSHGFLMKNGDSSVAYITDTFADESSPYLSRIQGVDTLIHECYFPEGWEEHAKLTGHSCLQPVARVAAGVNARRLYLVHINPMDESEGSNLDLESIHNVFPNTHVAYDELVIDV